MKDSLPLELLTELIIAAKQVEIWEWLAKERVYRHTITGQMISQRGMSRIWDGYQFRMRQEVRLLSARLAEGAINLETWELGMRQHIKDAYCTGYMLGHGGRNTMTFADWGSCGGQITNQYRYLGGFRDDIAIGNLSPAQIGARSELYINSSTQSFDRGRVRSMGAPELPAHPGDCSTVCCTNCKCYWYIEETDTAWLCYWRLTAAEHCADCLERAQIWNPLVIPKEYPTPTEVDRAALEEILAEAMPDITRNELRDYISVMLISRVLFRQYATEMGIPEDFADEFFQE